jgi:hypothetical protein
MVDEDKATFVEGNENGSTDTKTALGTVMSGGGGGGKCGRDRCGGGGWCKLQF